MTPFFFPPSWFLVRLMRNPNRVREILRMESYNPHPYIYTLTPTLDKKYQIYPLYKIKLNHSFTYSPHLFLEKVRNKQ